MINLYRARAQAVPEVRPRSKRHRRMHPGALTLRRATVPWPPPPPPPPQILVMFYAVELLRVMEAVHNAGFLHGDIKSDNILLRFEVLGEDELWDRQYHPDGSQGWSSCGTPAVGADRRADGGGAQP